MANLLNAEGSIRINYPLIDDFQAKTWIFVHLDLDKKMASAEIDDLIEYLEEMETHEQSGVNYMNEFANLVYECLCFSREADFS